MPKEAYVQRRSRGTMLGTGKYRKDEAFVLRSYQSPHPQRQAALQLIQVALTALACFFRVRRSILQIGATRQQSADVPTVTKEKAGIPFRCTLCMNFLRTLQSCYKLRKGSQECRPTEWKRNVDETNRKKNAPVADTRPP